jgi:hypothetical protein
MPSKAVVDAVTTYLSEVWTATAIIDPNSEAETPGDGSPFIAVQFPVARNSRPVVDRGLYREEGGFRIVINAERGKGAGQALIWADQLAVQFRDKKFGGVSCQVPSSPFIDDRNESGMYFKAAIVVPYTFNF